MRETEAVLNYIKQLRAEKVSSVFVTLLLTRVALMIPEKAAIAPAMLNATSLILRGEMPIAVAASRLPPTAKI